MTFSIRARLTAWYAVIVITVLVAGAAAVTIIQGRLGITRLDEELHRLLFTLEGVMRTEFNEGLDLAGAAAEARVEVIAPDRGLMIATADGRPVAQWGITLPEGWAPPAGAPGPRTITLQMRPFRIVHEPVEHGRHRYVAVVIAPLEGLAGEQSQLLEALTVGVLVSLVVAVAGGWIAGRQTLRPLGDMVRQATAISARDPSARLVAPHPDDELGRLAGAFNVVVDRLADALHAQRQFMADASHELRNPVSIVRATAQVTLQREQRGEDEYRESLSIVGEQATRLGRLVDSMFLLSRSEAQAIPIVRQHVYLHDLIGECVRALRVLASERDVQVHIAGDTEASLLADDGLLRQMIGNLLDNAIRHARAGGHVTLSFDQGDAVTIRVEDDGRGIPPADQDRIFGRFVRLDSGPGGAGLGLPIARWIAEQHGGRLVLEYSGPTGTCFAVTLPVEAAAV